jgi:hypothetical protein
MDTQDIVKALSGVQEPDLKKDLMNFVLDVKLSREEGGVHYPSDGVFSFKIYQQIKNLM